MAAKANSDRADIQRRPSLVAILLVIWLAFALRIHRLGYEAFWIDEILTLRTTQGGAAAILEQTAHPPLLYTLTALSVAAFGTSEFALRLPSLLAAMPAFPLLIALGTKWRQPGAGLWAALLLAISPLHVKYAQEARHYALLMTLSLASTLLLYRALQKPRPARWLAFAAITVADLYAHYGALMVLAAQMLLTGTWIAWRGRSSRRLWPCPAAAASLTLVLYLPWLPHLGSALAYNVGAYAVTETGHAVPAEAWLREAFYAFGMYYGYLPYLLLALALGGTLLWARQGRWPLLGFWLVSLALPPALILLFQVARGAYARYIIYALPLYLFPAGVCIHALLRRAEGVARPARRIATFSAAGAILLLGLPPVAREHALQQNDWHGIMHYLETHAADDDVFVTLALSDPPGTNPVDIPFAYYRERYELDQIWLTADQLQLDSLAPLEGQGGKAWLILLNTTANSAPLAVPAGNSVEVVPFQTRLFVARSDRNMGNALDELIYLLQQTLPLAPAAHHCLLYRDLAILDAARGQYVTADEELARVAASCPAGAPSRDEIHSAVYTGLQSALRRAAVEGDTTEARRVASRLLRYNAKEPAALDVLTAYNLLERFRQGEVQVENSAPEAVRVVRFTMPHNGDWGNALLLHPPAAVTYRLALPQAPLVFQSRVALAPRSWDWGGDGATFVVRLRRENGELVELYRQHVANDAPGRD